MTRRKKWLLAGAGTLLLGFVGGIGPWPLDKTPEAEPEAEALAIVKQQAKDLQQRHAAQAPRMIYAGWAEKDLDLPEGVPLAGYGARRGAASTGTKDGETLSARALVLRAGLQHEDTTVVIVCIDALLIHPEIARSIEFDVNYDVDPVKPVFLFTASHTHSGPGGWGDRILEELIAGDYDERARNAIFRAIYDSIHGAFEHLQPAEYAWIETQAEQHLRNRTVRDGEVDGTLEALVLRKTDSNELAVLALFGAHATCLGDDNRLLSADYPGHLVRALEADDRVSFAAFAAGCVGSHSPRAEGDGEQRARNLGESLAGQLLAELPAVDFRNQGRLSAAHWQMPTPDLQMRIGKSWRISPVATGLIQEPRARFSAMRLDDRMWLGVPFEVSGLLSRPLREHARASGFDGLTISSFQGDYLGYLIPDLIYAEGEEYEAQMSFLGPSGGSYFVDVIETFVENQKAMVPLSPPL